MLELRFRQAAVVGRCETRLTKFFWESGVSGAGVDVQAAGEAASTITCLTRPGSMERRSVTGRDRLPDEFAALLPT